MRHQRLGDRAAEVSLASGLVIEGVEDAEGRRPEPQRKPDRCGLFLIGHRKAGGEEFADILFLAGLGFEADV